MNAKSGSNSGCRPSLALQGRHNNGQGVSPIWLGMVWPQKHRAHALCYSMSPLPGLIQTIQTKTKTKTKTKFKPNSNPIRTQFKPKLEIHISSHAARDSEGGSNSRSYRHDELNNQLPSVLFRFSTHNAIFFVKH